MSRAREQEIWASTKRKKKSSRNGRNIISEGLPAEVDWGRRLADMRIIKEPERQWNEPKRKNA